VSHFPVRWHPWRRRSADPLRAPSRAFRSEPAEPPPPTEPAGTPQAPEGPSPTASLYARLVAYVPPQKRALYASGALVVLIVIVIIALASRPSHRVLRLLPKGLRSASVLDVQRFLNGPVYAALNAADHPAAGKFDTFEDSFDLDLRHDVSLLVATDQGLVLFGRFRPERVRSAYEESVQGQLRGRLPQFRTRYVEGRAYTFCSQGTTDRAFATIGSSVACFGTRHAVRRFLKVRAGLFDSLRKDEAVAAAYDDRLARRAFLYRIEKAGGPVLKSLDPILKSPAPAPGEAPAEADKGLRSAFFALATRSDAIRLVARFVAKSEGAAEKLAKQLEEEPAVAALRKLLGTDEGPGVTRSETIVTLEAALSLEAFAEIVKKNKEDPHNVRNLLIALIAR
jgi:hypothetical protein